MIAMLAVTAMADQTTFVIGRTADTVLSLLAVSVFNLVLGPLPEEIGWRGYALDALQTGPDPLQSTVILFAGWALWHVPLSLMQGYYDDFGGRPHIPLFFWNLAMTSVILTWLNVRTNRSFMLAVSYHFMINFTGEILPRSAKVKLAFTSVMSAADGAILTHWFKRAGRDRSLQKLAKTSKRRAKHVCDY